MRAPRSGLRTRRIGRRAAMAALLGAGLTGPAPRALARTEPIPDGVPPMALRPLGVLAIDTQALGTDSLSGLHVGPGGVLTAVGDRGRWARARLRLSPEGAPLGLEAPEAGPLRDTAGRPFPRGFIGDAECLAALPDGSWLVGFERNHRIWRYPRIDGAAEPAGRLPGLERAPSNAGIEALGVLPDGRWLAISEGLRIGMDPTLRTAWLGRPGRWRTLNYRTTPGYDPSDLCPLPDGGALVLERLFSPWDGRWFRGRVLRLPPIPAAPTLLEGREVARLEPPLQTDNWEGISAFPHEGRLLVALVSDDNDFALQRSLLMTLAFDQPTG